MKHLFLIATLSLSANALASDCGQSDRLFKGSESYTCTSTEDKTTVCVNFGVHGDDKVDAIHIFKINPPEETAGVLFMNRPVWHNCHLPLIACTNESVENNDTRLRGYRYRSPDFWDARSGLSEFDLDKHDGTASLETTGWDVNGQESGHTVTHYQDCK